MSINNFEVSIEMSEDFRYEGDIKYTFDIPYDHEIFKKEYSESLNLERPTDSDEFNDEVAKIRDEIEEGIRKYLEENNKLIEIEY